MNWWDVILMPILFTIFLLTFYFVSSGDDKIPDENLEDYELLKKQMDRDKKIKKILKRW